MDDTDEDTLDDATYKVYKTPKKLNSQFKFGNGWYVSSKSAWCTATQSSTGIKQKLDTVFDTYKSTIAKAYSVSMYVLDTTDSVFEERDAQWKAAELDWLHDAMRDKLKTASYPQKVQILIPDKQSQECESKQIDVSEYLIRTACEFKKVGGILAKPVPKKVKHFHKKLSI